MKIKFILWIIILAAIIIAAVRYTSGFFSLKTDAYWLELDTLLHANGLSNSSFPDFKLDQNTIEQYKIVNVLDKYDELEKLYLNLHKNNTDIELFENIINNPFILIDEYDKFTEFLNLVLKKRKLVLEGVSGSGKSTLIDRVARIITGNSENILNLDCVEKLETEYHKLYVGYYDINRFIPGKLLKFIKKAQENQNENFIFIIDDIDKIYPATLFGNVIWKELDNPVYTSNIEGYEYEIIIPDNLYIISITHSDVGNVIDFNAEHYRRLGEPYFLLPNENIFLLNILEKQEKNNFTFQHIKKLIYTFKSINEKIVKNYGFGSALGQWSNVRKKIQPEQFDEFIKEFITNVNAFKPQKELNINNLNDIISTIENDGKIPQSSDLHQVYFFLEDSGIFSELTVALTFTLLSALIGFLVFKRRQKFIESLNKRIIQIQDDYINKIISMDNALTSIIEHKNKIKKLVSTGKIKYEEYVFFSIFINEVIKKIEETKNLNEITSGFDETLTTYLEDGQLDDEEFKILQKFLENLKSALPLEIYYTLKKQIEDIHLRNQ